MEQFDSKSALKARQLFIIERQQKFHRQVSRALLSLHLNDSPSIKHKEEMEDDISSESEAEGEETKESMKVAFQQDCYDTSKSPYLSKIFDQTVSKCHLNALLLEIFNLVGSKSSSVDFN